MDACVKSVSNSSAILVLTLPIRGLFTIVKFFSKLHAFLPTAEFLNCDLLCSDL